MISHSGVRTVPDSFWPPDVTLVSALQKPSILPTHHKSSVVEDGVGELHREATFEKGTGEQGNRSGTGQDSEIAQRTLNDH